MEEITMYKAEDGTLFENYDECAKYEQKDLLENFLGKVTMFDYEGKCISIEEEGSVHEILCGFELCAYLRFEDENAVKAFSQFLSQNDCVQLILDESLEEKTFIPGKIYRYDLYQEAWFNFSKETEKQVAFEKELREWGK